MNSQVNCDLDTLVSCIVPSIVMCILLYIYHVLSSHYWSRYYWISCIVQLIVIRITLHIMYRPAAWHLQALLCSNSAHSADSGSFREFLACIFHFNKKTILTWIRMNFLCFDWFIILTRLYCVHVVIIVRYLAVVYKPGVLT